MKHILTDVFVRTVAPPAKGRLEFGDLTRPGLWLRVGSGGARSWSFRFVDKLGKETRYGIGNYPDVKLAAARDRALALREDVAKGINPTASKRQERVEAPKKTFEHLATRYMTEHAKRHKKSWDQDERNLRLHVLPKWKDRPYAEVVRSDTVELVEDLIKAGTPTLANRVGALVGKIFAFGIDAGLLTQHPATRLGKRGPERVCKRVLDDAEIRMFWRRIVQSPVSPTVGLSLRLELLTAMRPSEVAGLRRDELRNFNDPKQAAIVLPPLRAKNARGHLVPLTRLARSVIAEALAIAPSDSAYVFESPEVEDSGIEGHSLAVAMRRFCEDLTGDEPGVASWRADRPTPKDLRRTARTRFSELRVPEEIKDHLMNHKSQSTVGRKHYDLWQYVDEKRAALEAWTAMVSAILDGNDGGKVVRLRRTTN